MSQPLQIEPRVTLVGAGPGDPALLTVGGLKAIHSANVVLFDALVSQEILAEIPDGVVTINVGKRGRQVSLTQDEINKLIVTNARAHGHAVRLKGGDPFVFGRGFEEAAYVLAAGIPVEVIPGVTSAIAAPAKANIPVTLRGVSEGFFVITGTNKDEKVSDELQVAAKSGCTVVILMGLGNIADIMGEFLAAGKPELPVAVIENGTLPHARVVTGTASDITIRVEQAQIGPPAIIIAGEVVRHAELLRPIGATFQQSIYQTHGGGK